MKRILDLSILATTLIVSSVIGAIGCADAEPPKAEGDAGPGQTVTVPPSTPTQTTDSGTPTTPSPTAVACGFETRSFVIVDGRLVESITFGGRLFNFETNGAPWQSNGVDLTDISGYAAGPCRGRARGQCSFDTRTFVPVNDALIESVTAYGSYWSFDAKGQATSVDLALMPRYRSGGPCDGRAAGQCKFETRTFLTEGSDIVESITAYGKSFNYKLDGTPLAGNGVDLSAVPRYAAGPCAGKAAGQCVFETRVFEMVNGHLLETVTASGKVFHYQANGAAALAEVQPSNVVVETLEPWASGVCKK